MLGVKAEKFYSSGIFLLYKAATIPINVEERLSICQIFTWKGMETIAFRMVAPSKKACLGLPFHYHCVITIEI